MPNETKSSFQDMVTRTTAAIGVKTSVFVGSAKVRTHINTIKKEISRLSLELGNTVYALWEKDETDAERIDQQCQAIRDKYDEIAKLSDEIVRLEKQEAEVLGVKKEQSPKPPTETASSVFICPGCQSEFNTPSKFCRKCGARMPE